MKLKLFKKYYIYIIMLNYIIIPFILWFLLSYIGIILGLIIAWFIDKIWPEWAFDLSWNDFSNALNNLYFNGMNGSVLTILIKDIKVFVFRDIPKKRTRMGIKLLVSDWIKYFPEKELSEIGYSCSGKYWFKTIKGNKYFYFTPTNEIEGCLAIIKDCIIRVNGGLTSDIAATVNAAKIANIWQKIDY